jgi:phage-related protein (TIGR01555 family)
MPTRMDDVDALARISGGSGAEIVARMYQNYTRGTQQLDRASIQYFYRRYGILKKLVNVPANQMTYRWGYLQLGGKRGDAKIRDAFEAFTDQLPVETLYNHRLGLRTAFGLAQKAANKMGNGAILMDLDDGEDLDRPINFNKLKGIRRLYVLDRWSLKPLIIGSTRDHDFYQLGGVAFSRFLTDVRRGAAVQAVHKSRVLWFRGEELDDNELMRTGGCDDSVFESTISSFLDYRASICGAKQMIEDFDIFVHELEGLLTELETDGNQEYETLIRERIEINDRMRRLHRTMLVDKDKERIGHSSRQVSGYSDLMDRVLNDFLANVELTPAELLGKYPEGMADTGQTEQQNANDRTSRYQEEKFRSNIVAFCKVLFRCKEFVTQGKIPDTWKFVFELLYPVTPPEQAELQLNYAQIDDINIRNGVYSGDDVARSRYGSADFQPNIIIDFKKREAAQKAAQEGETPPEGEGAPEDDIEALLANYQTDAADPVRLLPPPEVRQAVQQALKFAREKGIKIPATLQPLTLNLSMGVPLREEEVRSMNLFFMQPKNRKVAKQPPEEGYGAILWLAMGGDIGERWSGAIEREFLRRRDGVRADVVTVSARTDDDTPIKRAIHWKEYQIGLQYEALDERHGRILPLAYGEFLGLRSEHDGMNADVYVGSELGSDRVFAVTQLDYDTGEFDEVKFIIGVHKPIDEVAKLYQAIMTPQHFGGIVEITKEEIPTYQPQTYLMRRGDAIKPEHVAAVFQSISGHNDAISPLQVEGSLLSEKEWESLTDVSSAEARAALKQWKKAAPEQFEEILEATEEGE